MSEKSMDLTNVEAAEVLSKFISDVKIEDIPETGKKAVIRAIVDGIGVTLAGLNNENSKIAGSFVNSSSMDGLPLEGDTDAERAELALYLGTAAHSLDYDDIAHSMNGHPTAVLLPTILALADRTDPSGEKAITAYAAGLETASYVAEPISPSHYEAGWHATSTFGAIGATATAASLLNLDTETTEMALNIAASTPSGLKENFGTMTKPLHAGLASRSGITAAMLAAGGFTAGKKAINGEKGFWSLYSGEADPTDLPPRPTSGGWNLVEPGIHLKRYPACYFTHTAITATKSIIKSHDISADDIIKVKVKASGAASDALKYAEPETALQSKFSMPHAVAVALTSDRVGVDDFKSKSLSDSILANRRSLVEFSIDEELPYDSHTATVTIDTVNNTYKELSETPPWRHQNPPGRDELMEKFMGVSTQIVDQNDARTAFNRLQDLENVSFLSAVDSIRN